MLYNWHQLWRFTIAGDFHLMILEEQKLEW